MATLLSEIELFINAHGMSETTFGKLAMKGDPHFVKGLRNGRDIRMSTERRVRQFMLSYPQHQQEAA